ncbi:MAG: CpsD/CapB family tyrosine-protein kinase [Chloroflexota bacterium]
MTSSRRPDNPSVLAPVSRNGRALATAEGSHLPLAMVTQPHSPTAEAYRALAANLQFASLENRLSTVGVTSPSTSEGKSTTVANLAIALAEGGRRVIVIDADLRRPALHTLFSLSGQDGLSTVLLDERDHLPLQDPGLRDVRVLTSGPTPPNPLDALASRRFDHILALARAQADIVVVDTAPAGALADAAVVAPRLEGMLLVISSGTTRRDLAQRARQQLERVNANLLGVVLTDVRGDDKLYRY